MLDIDGAEAAFKSLSVDLLRLRLNTEVRHEHVLAIGGSLIPWGELGLRHDGGAGENGAGLELGGGVRYVVPEAGWTVEGNGRWLALHGGALQTGWGADGLLRFNPGASGLGASADLSLSWGGNASGMRQLWETDSTAPNLYHEAAGRHQARLAYGVPALGGRGILTPYVQLSLGDGYGRVYRLGGRLSIGRNATMSLEAERKEHSAASAAHAITARGSLQF